jgi:hypothetical protein
MPFESECISAHCYDDAVAEKLAAFPSYTSYDMAIGLQQFSQSSTYDCSPELRSSSMEIFSQQ